MADRFDADPGELRGLATAASEAERRLHSASDNVARVMASLDRRGWNAAGADSGWWSVRDGLATLQATLRSETHDLLARADLLEQTQNGVTPTATPTPEELIATATPMPTPEVTPRPEPAPTPYRAPTPERGNGPDIDLTGDFIVSRAADAAQEYAKYAIKPATGVVRTIVEEWPVEVVRILGPYGQTIGQVTRVGVPVLHTVDEVVVKNTAAVAFKEFLEHPFGGAPVISGVIQGVSDWVTEPDLTTEQRVGRVAVAAGLAVVVGAGAVALAGSVGLGVGVAAGIGIVAAAGADVLVKPWIFETTGLNAPKRDAHTDESGNTTADR